MALFLTVLTFFYTLPHDSGGVLWYIVLCWLSVCPSIYICPSVCHTSVHPYFRFRTITLVNINRFSPNSVCALILWISGLGLLMGKFHQFLTELSACYTSVFSFPDDNFKCQLIFTKLGVCIDIVETWFEIPDGQILSIFDRVICP